MSRMARLNRVHYEGRWVSAVWYRRHVLKQLPKCRQRTISKRMPVVMHAVYLKELKSDKPMATFMLPQWAEGWVKQLSRPRGAYEIRPINYNP